MKTQFEWQWERWENKMAHLKVFTLPKEVKIILLVHFTLESFMDLSTWHFDPHLLDQTSLSKRVAYESVDRFVTHTWMCQNVSLSVSRAYCHKNIKLLPPSPHLSLFILPMWLEITNDQACRYFQQDGRVQEAKSGSRLLHHLMWTALDSGIIQGTQSVFRAKIFLNCASRRSYCLVPSSCVFSSVGANSTAIGK